MSALVFTLVLDHGDPRLFDPLICTLFVLGPPIRFHLATRAATQCRVRADVLRSTLMETRQFGKTDMRVSVLGFGGAEIGFEEAAAEVVKTLLDDALDAGLNVIDTAECYLASEELIGQAVAGRREQFHLFTKCGHPETPGVGDWRPESLLASIERSLKRLRTDRLDLVHCTVARKRSCARET